MPRSSISKTPLIMKNSVGLIDAGYLGNIKAPLYNTSSEPFYITRGQRYVQLVNGDLSPVNMEIVTEHRDLNYN
jgi:dUTP pyrophosphatase